MPMSSYSQQQQTIHCQQADDFTVVSTTANENDKENQSRPRNYQTLNQTIALERLQLLRVIELENTIFTKAFHLIETYYRPTNASVWVDPNANENTQHSKRKRRSKTEQKMVANPTDNSETLRHLMGAMELPRKRIHGLSKAYKAEYNTKIGQPGISKHFGTFHHNQIDWQLVFVSAIDNSTTGNNLAKELNYDSLFDYEDAICTTATILAAARQQADLIEGLVMCAQSHGKPTSTDYVPDQAKNGASLEFRKLIAHAEQLIQHKKKRIDQLREKMNPDNTGTQLMPNWFKADKSSIQLKETYGQKEYFEMQQLLREITAWEEFVDVVEIVPK